MADPICRWRNPYVSTIVELANALPHQKMFSDDFRTIIEKRWPGFLHTPYQLACQTGLYYESEDRMYHPRFKHDIDEDEAFSYMSKWIARYYVPNPYTKSMKTLQQPQPFLASIIRYVYEHPDETELHHILEAVFQEKIGNIDIVSNVLNTYTDLIKVDSFGNVELTDKAIDFMKQYIDRNDKKAFFENFSENNNTDDNNSKNLVFYGAPGTGKSHTINETTEKQPKDNVYRTTFHPDSDYSTFVGCYKPSMKRPEKIYTEKELTAKLKEIKESGVTYPCHKFATKYWESLKDLDAQSIKNILSACGFTDSMAVEVSKGIAIGQELLNATNDGKIVYDYSPQAFTKAYLRAWQTEEPVYLVIEEINRGNCAQIFGDLFQLLDRKNGFSEYPIKPDNDLATYIGEQLSKESREGILETVKSGEELILPPNLYIWATMNTSDQSLFPIDSAFKRRWEWVYMPIDTEKEKWYIEINGSHYSWTRFLNTINDDILTDETAEDKHLGFYFCKATKKKEPSDVDPNVITAETFVGKVLFYLWNDVFKVYGIPTNIGTSKDWAYRKFYRPDGTVNQDKVAELMSKLKIESEEEGQTANED